MTTVVLNTVTRKVEVFSSARDVQARAEIADHKAAADPHPQYLADADAADIALSGDAGDLIAGTVPDARMPSWTGYTLASRTALEAANVPTAVAGLRLLGHAAAGDGGGAHYKRAASEPAHAGKMQSNDGAWWEIASTILAPEMFGTDGVDDGPALQSAADVSKALKRPVVGRGEYLLASAVDFSEAVIDFSAATIKLADNFAPAVAITLGQPDGATSTTLGRYSADLFIDGNKANQSGTPIAVLIEDLITPSMKFVIRGADCNTLCKIQGAAEYVSVDVHADRCDLACHLTEKTVAPLSDATPDDILINIYGHSCSSYFKADGTQHITAKVNLFTEQGGAVGDRAVELVGTLGEFNIGGIIRSFGGIAVHVNMSSVTSMVMFDHLQIDGGAGAQSVDVVTVGVVAGFVSMRSGRRIWLQQVTRAVNLSVVSNACQMGPVVRIGSGSTAVSSGVLNIATGATPAVHNDLMVQKIDNGLLDIDGNARALNVNLQTDGSGAGAILHVTNGLNLAQANCPVDWLAGEVTFDALKKDTSGMTASVEVADDGFIAFTPPHRAHRIMVRERNRPHYFMGFARVDAPGVAAVMTEFHSSANYDGTTGALTGTTGIDGNVTVSVHTDGKLYIENRRGAAIRFWVVLD